jgi:ATP-dependent Zn protease
MTAHQFTTNEVAVHEAAHAVAALHFGIACQGATLTPLTPDHTGYVACVSVKARELEERIDEPKREHYAREVDFQELAALDIDSRRKKMRPANIVEIVESVKVLVAGYTALKRYLDSPNLRGAASDFQEAKQLLNVFLEDGDALDTFLEYAFGSVHNFLEDSCVKAKILAVSDALEQAGTLTKGEIEAILEEVPCQATGPSSI